MFPVSPDDLLSQAEIHTRLALIKASTPHGSDALKRRAEPELRVRDIATFLGVKPYRVYDSEAPRLLQKELSWFFHLWDAGALQMVRGDDPRKRWILIRRDSSLAKMAAASDAQAPAKRHRLDLTMTPDGPRLKVNGSN